MKRLAGSFAVGFLLFGLFFQVTIAQDNTDQANNQQLLAQLKKQTELTDLRTENSMTFQDKSGRKTVYLSDIPLNYQEKDGKYFPIETKLISDKVTKGLKFRHRALKNVLQAQFADFSDGGLLLNHGKSRIEFWIQHPYKRKAVISKNKIRYEKVFKNGDLQYTVLPGSVKDELIFSSVPAEPIISYKVDFGNLKHKTAKDGTIELVDENGKTVFNLLPSVMFEKNNEKAFKRIDTRFHWEKGQLFCDLILDMKWLKDKRRKYPVVIDPTLVSNGPDTARYLLHTPESGVAMRCEINVDTSPEWKGWWGTTYDPINCYFKDLTIGQQILGYNDLVGTYHKSTPEDFVSAAGHDYELVVHGGKSVLDYLIGHEEYPGHARAIIEYGDLYNSTLPYQLKRYDSTVESNTITKDITVKRAQTITFNYAAGLQIGKIIGKDSNGNPILSPQNITGGKLELQENAIYRISLAAQPNGEGFTHYQVAINIPYSTVNYESRIVLGTFPGYIESTFKVPADSDLRLRYSVPQGEGFSFFGNNFSYPSVKLYEVTGTARYEKTFHSDYYNNGIDGADTVTLSREVPYRLVISRGQSGYLGWGHITLTVDQRLNSEAYVEVGDLSLFDQAGKPINGQYAKGDYRLGFNYQDPETNSLKEYTLVVEKTGKKPIRYIFRNPTVQNGKVIIPKAVGSLGLTSGDQVLFKIEKAWDGFDDFGTKDGVAFTIDNIAPIIAPFQESLNENNTLTLQCIATENANGSGLKSRVLSWRADSGILHAVDLDSSTPSYSLEQLPPNSKVTVTLTATDNVDNVTSRTGVFYTYPEKSRLVAPVRIDGTAAERYQTTLKVSKVQASLYRIERYRDHYAPDTKEYDTGYLDPSAFKSMKAGPPSIGVNEPYDNTIFTRPANIKLATGAFDVDGKIQKVEFFNGNTLIGTVTGSPYTITWNNVPLGNYVITAKAIDDDGLVGTSTPVHFSVVNIPPTVSIKNSVTGNDSTGAVNINATVTDPDSTITKVEFYLGATLLATDTSAPYGYNFTWSSPYNTVYPLTAKAYDSDGGNTVSSPVNIIYNHTTETKYELQCHMEDRNCHQVCEYVCYWWICNFPGCYICGNGANECQTVCDQVPVCENVPIYINHYSFTISNGPDTTLTPDPTPTPTPTEPPASESEDCYWIPDRPADRHGKYVYRIYTKNGDKEFCLESAVIPVADNSPEIISIQPAQGGNIYINGVITIAPQVIDRDEDDLKYTYTITPDGSAPLTSGEVERADWTFGSVSSPLNDGKYTWAVTIRDDFGGSTTTSGTMQVDKYYPSAAFQINEGAMYTTGSNVQIAFNNISSNVKRIELANTENGPWANIADWSRTTNWSLSSGDGSKTVYLRATSQTDKSIIIEHQIVMDATIPDISNLVILKTGDNGKVSFAWVGGSDGGSGLGAKVNIRYDNGLENKYVADYINSEISLPVDGYNTPVQIQVQLMDRAGNRSAWTSPVTGHTKAAPGGLDLANTTTGYSLQTGHYIDLKLKPTEGATKYSVECTQNPGNGYNGPIDPGTLSYQNMGLSKHQQYRFKVYTYNSDNEVTSGEESGIIEISNIFLTAIPTGITPSGFIRQTETAECGFGSSFKESDPEGDPLTVEYYLSNDGENYQELDSAILTNLQNGTTYWWYAIIDDGWGGHAQTAPVSFIPDTEAPEITVDNISMQYATEHRVRLTASDTVSGLATLKYSLNGSALTAYGDEILINRQGTNSLYVEATDNAGNVAVFSHQYYIDLTPPDMGTIQFNLDSKDGKYLASDNKTPVQWSASDPETGIAQFKYAWSESSGGCDPASMQSLILLDQQSTYQNIFSYEFEDGKTYYLYIQPVNFLGQAGPVIQSPPLFYDHTGPVVGVTGLSGGMAFSGQYYLTDLKKLVAEISAADTQSGIVKTEYALVTGTDLTNATWYTSMDELQSQAWFEQGKTYYLAIKATNGTGLAATALSVPIYAETTPPLVIIDAPAAQADTKLYSAQVKVSDTDTMVTQLQYCIGTAPDKADLSQGLAAADENGWITVNYPAETMELHQYATIPRGLTYYFTVRAFNIAGLTGKGQSNGTQVTGPTNTAPEVSDDGYYTSDQTMLHFIWNFTASTKPVQKYQYRIRSGEGIVRSWTDPTGTQELTRTATEDFSLTATGLALANNTEYYCDIQATYGDGSLSGIGSSNGIRTDFTPPVIQSFISPAYAGGQGIPLSWEATDPESGIQCFLGLGTTPGANDVSRGWLSLGNLKAFQINRDKDGNTITFDNGRKYYATLMIANGSGLTVQKTSPAVKIDLTPPLVPVVLDDGSYTNRADRLRSNWKWTPGDPESGIKEYQYTVTTKQALSGGEYWISSGLETDMELTGLNLNQGTTYYIAVKIVNKAGLETVGFSDGILVDTTAPGPPLALDFGDYSLSNNALKVDLLASDAESGIDRYELSLGTLDNPGAVFKNRQVLTSVGLDHLELTGLSLEEGKIYFFTISAINNANLRSLDTMSDGIMTDSVPPKLTKVQAQGRYLTDPTRLSFDWEAAASPSGICFAQYALTTDPNGANLTWQDLDLSGSMNLTGLNLESNETYYLFVHIQNRALAEVSKDQWSLPVRSAPVTIDQEAPKILSVIVPENGYTSNNLKLHWTAWAGTSGIAEYRYAVGSDRGGSDISDGWVTFTTTNTEVSFERNDLPFGDKLAYYISVMAKNGAGVWSPIYKTGAIRTDLTPPVVTKLEYGSNYLRSYEAITGIGWEANDPETGVAAYRVKMVTVKDNKPLDSDIVPVGEASGTINLTGLALKEGQTYYIALQIQNHAGGWSPVYYSHGIKVDKVPPQLKVIGGPGELVTNSGQMDVVIESSEPATIVASLEDPSGALIDKDRTLSVEKQVTYPFNYSTEGKYALRLTPTDPAGNTGETLSQVIRLNAKPFAGIGPDLTVTKGTTVTFNQDGNKDIKDNDGTIVAYQWDFGDGVTSTETAPSHTYTVTGDYHVTLKVQDNDGKWSDPATCKVTVTNTFAGELKLDEDWEGEILISGNVVVPRGITLRIKAGTGIDFTGNYQIQVLGRMVTEGTATNPIVIGGNTPWNGIRLEKPDSASAFYFTTIRGAAVGLILYEAEAQLDGCTFDTNNIGLHILHCNPVLRNCSFQGNGVYGVKEDDGATPTVTDCGFTGNGIDYYEEQLGIISIPTLNSLGENKGNH